MKKEMQKELQSELLQIKVTPTTKKKLQIAAEKDNRTVTNWIRVTLEGILK